MSNPLTDEQLVEWERRWNAQSVEGQVVRALIQEVRRLRDELQRTRESAYYLSGRRLIKEAVERAEKAEAERDRYKRWAKAVYKLAAGKLPTDSPISPQAVMDIFDQQEPA